jgi:hypothetical protein
MEVARGVGARIERADRELWDLKRICDLSILSKLQNIPPKAPQLSKSSLPFSHNEP